MTKVFISSTGEDLTDYRQAAIETCNRLGLTPIAMEFFEAMGVGATEGSKRKLDEADLYVGVFAHRYGYIEDGYDKAVTEIEFDYAGERGLDRLCFLIKPDYPWRPNLIDHKNYDKLENLKEEVNKLIRAEFTTVDDFKAKLTQSLSEWQKQQEAARATRDEFPKEIPPCAEKMLARNQWFADPQVVSRTRLSDKTSFSESPLFGILYLIRRIFSGEEGSAVTLGNTIYFLEPGSYNPHTAEGLAVLARELKQAELSEQKGPFGQILAFVSPRSGQEVGQFQDRVKAHLEKEFEENQGRNPCQEMGNPHTPNKEFVTTEPEAFLTFLLDFQ